MTSLFRLHKKQLEASFRARGEDTLPDSDPQDNKRLVHFYASSILLLLCFVGLATLASVSKTPVWRLIALCLMAHIPYAVVLVSNRRGLPSPIRLKHIIVFAAVFRVVLVAAPPTFSDDIYRYVWDGRVLLSGENPYRYAPLDETLAPLRDSSWSKINHPELKTIYPPISEGLFAAIAAISATPTAFKAASAAADIGIILLIFLLLRGITPKNRARQTTEHDKNDEHSSSGTAPFPWDGPDKQNTARNGALFGALAYGFNPLACVETAMSGHLEPFALLGILAAIYALKIGKEKLGALCLSLAVAIKLAPLLLLPSMARKRIGIWLTVLLLLLASYAAFSAGAGTGTVESLDTFARRWEGNGGLFVVVKSLNRQILETTTGATNDTDMIHIPQLDLLASKLHGTFFSLHKDSEFRPEAPGSFPLLDLTLALTKVTLGLVLIGVCALVIVKKFAPIRAATWIFATLVVVTPVLHPWYILWILPLSIINGHWPWLVLAGMSVLAYIPLDGWWSRGVWESPIYISILEYGTFVVAVIVYQILDRRRKSL